MKDLNQQIATEKSKKQQEAATAATNVAAGKAPAPASGAAGSAGDYDADADADEEDYHERKRAAGEDDEESEADEEDVERALKSVGCSENCLPFSRSGRLVLDIPLGALYIHIPLSPAYFSHEGMTPMTTSCLRARRKLARWPPSTIRPLTTSPSKRWVLIGWLLLRCFCSSCPARHYERCAFVTSRAFMAWNGVQDFYHEHAEVTALTDEQVAQLRAEMGLTSIWKGHGEDRRTESGLEWAAREGWRGKE